MVAIEAPVAARQSTHVGWLLRLPYPLRNALGRWRSLVSMVLGVGIALSIGMTLLAVISAEMDIISGDYARSGIGLYVATQGGKIVAILQKRVDGILAGLENQVVVLSQKGLEQKVFSFADLGLNTEGLTILVTRSTLTGST